MPLVGRRPALRRGARALRLQQRVWVRGELAVGPFAYAAAGGALEGSFPCPQMARMPSYFHNFVVLHLYTTDRRACAAARRGRSFACRQLLFICDYELTRLRQGDITTAVIARWHENDQVAPTGRIPDRRRPRG